MMTNSKPRVAVVGGGVIGVSTAQHLARAGADVVLVTDGELANNTSGRSLSWLNSAGAYSEVYHRLRIAGIDRYRTVAARHRVSDWLRFDGGLTWSAARRPMNSTPGTATRWRTATRAIAATRRDRRSGAWRRPGRGPGHRSGVEPRGGLGRPAEPGAVLDQGLPRAARAAGAARRPESSRGARRRGARGADRRRGTLRGRCRRAGHRCRGARDGGGVGHHHSRGHNRRAAGDHQAAAARSHRGTEHAARLVAPRARRSPSGGLRLAECEHHPGCGRSATRCRRPW